MFYINYGFLISSMGIIIILAHGIVVEIEWENIVNITNKLPKLSYAGGQHTWCSGFTLYLR